MIIENNTDKVAFDTEKDFQNYIINNWNRLMGKLGISFYKKEFHIERLNVISRCDILAYKQKNYDEYENLCGYKIPYFIELKFDGNSRDLINELERLNKIRDFQLNKGLKAYTVVLSNYNLDLTNLDYMKKNGVYYLKYDKHKDEVKYIKYDNQVDSKR